MHVNSFNWSVELGVRAVPQPHPQLNKVGDCGACCLGGAIGWDASRFPELYENTLQPYHGGQPRKVDSINWGDLLHRGGPWLHSAMRLIEPIEIEPILPDMRNWQHNLHNPYAMAPWSLAGRWLHRLRLHLMGGYVGMTTISSGGRGPFQVRDGGKRVFEGTDHWVLLNGAKQVWEPCEGGGWVLGHYAKVSCSVKGDYWICADDLLTTHGGYWVAFIRRVPPVTPVSSVDVRR